MNRSKRNMIIAAILLMAVGFAAISTTLYINGTATIGNNAEDFDVYFSSASIDGVDAPGVISQDKKSITYETKTLTDINDVSTLEYEVTNASRNYNVEISISCENDNEDKTIDYSDYYSFDTSNTPTIVEAGTRETGSVVITLTHLSTETLQDKFKCTLTANATERTVLADPILTVDPNSGLFDENGEQIADWNTLVNDYGLNIGNNYTYSNYNTNNLSSENIKYNVNMLDGKDNDYKVNLLANGTGNSMTYVLRNNQELQSARKLVIPIEVDNIGAYSFYRCLYLTEIVIGDGVTRIGISAFQDSTSLTSVTIGDSVTSIGSDAFNNCRSLTSVTIPNGVISIGYQAFSNCKKLTSITIPDSVTYIGSDAFSDCTSLTSITIPDSVTSIVYGAFSGCTSLTSITIPDGVTRIEEDAFYNCTSLTSVTIGNSVTRIGSRAFSGCISLTSITIPDSVTYLGNNVFDGVQRVEFISTFGSYDNNTLKNMISSGYYDRVFDSTGTSLEDYLASTGSGSS